MEYTLRLEGESSSPTPEIPTVANLRRNVRKMFYFNTTHTHGYTGLPVPFRHSVKVEKESVTYGVLAHFASGFHEDGWVEGSAVLESIIKELDELHEEAVNKGVNPDNIGKVSNMHYTRILMSKALSQGKKVLVQPVN